MFIEEVEYRVHEDRDGKFKKDSEPSTTAAYMRYRISDGDRKKAHRKKAHGKKAHSEKSAWEKSVLGKKRTRKKAHTEKSALG